MQITLQPARITNRILDDGTELQQRPYPFYADEDGKLYIALSNLAYIVGFVKDCSKFQVDIWWRDAVKDINQVVGMYMITANKDGTWDTRVPAIEYVEVQ